MNWEQHEGEWKCLLQANWKAFWGEILAKAEARYFTTLLQQYVSDLIAGRMSIEQVRDTYFRLKDIEKWLRPLKTDEIEMVSAAVDIMRAHATYEQRTNSVTVRCLPRRQRFLELTYRGDSVKLSKRARADFHAALCELKKIIPQIRADDFIVIAPDEEGEPDTEVQAAIQEILKMVEEGWCG